MSGAILSPEDRAHLLLMMRRQTPSSVHRRMNALLLLHDGWRAERVAEALFIDPDTVREHLRLYQASGVAGVGHLKCDGSEPALNEEQLRALGAELDAHLYMTAKAVCADVERTFNLTYTPLRAVEPKVIGRYRLNGIWQAAWLSALSAISGVSPASRHKAATAAKLPQVPSTCIPGRIRNTMPSRPPNSYPATMAARTAPSGSARNNAAPRTAAMARSPGRPCAAGKHLQASCQQEAAPMQIAKGAADKPASVPGTRWRRGRRFLPPGTKQ
jgi:transposase